MTVTLVKLDARWFPFLCCGRLWADSRVYMDHALPSHLAGIVPSALARGR